MRKLIMIIFIFTSPMFLLAQENETELVVKITDSIDTSKPAADSIVSYDDGGYKEGFNKGKYNATMKDYSPWLKTSVSLSTGCTVFGAGSMCLYSNSYCDYPITIPPGSSEFKRGFQDGYINTTRTKRNLETLKGALMGMFVMPLSLIGLVALALASMP